MKTYIYLNLNLHLHLHLLKNRLIALCSNGLRHMVMAMETNWPFGTVSGQKLTGYLTTGPVSTALKKAYVLPGSKKLKADVLNLEVNGCSQP